MIVEFRDIPLRLLFFRPLVKSLETELIDPAAGVAGNASRFPDNHRSSSRPLAFLRAALSAASRLFAAPTGHRSIEF